jgi:hypothetical protein
MKDSMKKALKDLDAALTKAGGKRLSYALLTEDMTAEEKEFEVYSHLRRNSMSDEQALRELPKILDSLRIEASPRHSA